MKKVLLAAGGTGGHVFVAESVAEVLKEQGFSVSFLTDKRGASFTTFPDLWILPISYRTGVLGRLLLIGSLIGATLRTFFSFLTSRPNLVVGFGGYPSIPAVMGAALLKIPVLLHEQNAVLGRSNRWLSRFSKCLALSFPYTQQVPQNVNTVITGNPIRPSLGKQATPYQKPAQKSEGAEFNVLVLGGSQGATFFSASLPRVFKDLPSLDRKRLVIYQQCRPELLKETEKAYAGVDFQVHLEPFFKNISQRLNEAHLVIARSGAGMLAELSVFGRPAILIPYPTAMDDHQTANAHFFREGGWVIQQARWNSQELRDLLLLLLEQPDLLESKAQKMKEKSSPQAVFKLVETIKGLLTKDKRDRD